MQSHCFQSNLEPLLSEHLSGAGTLLFSAALLTLSQEHGWPLWNGQRVLWPKLWRRLLGILRPIARNNQSRQSSWKTSWPWFCTGVKNESEWLLCLTLFWFCPESILYMFCVECIMQCITCKNLHTCSPGASYPGKLGIWIDPVTRPSVSKCFFQCEASDVGSLKLKIIGTILVLFSGTLWKWSHLQLIEWKSINAKCCQNCPMGRHCVRALLFCWASVGSHTGSHTVWFPFGSL